MNEDIYVLLSMPSSKSSKVTCVCHLSKKKTCVCLPRLVEQRVSINAPAPNRSTVMGSWPLPPASCCYRGILLPVCSKSSRDGAPRCSCLRLATALTCLPLPLRISKLNPSPLRAEAPASLSLRQLTALNLRTQIHFRSNLRFSTVVQST
jgi:hypothetical protein